jgi:hypothetical protein
MSTQIAVATLSGREYYVLVNELKKRLIPFISLKPGEPIPVYVKVVITTVAEKSKIRYPRILVYDLSKDAGKIVDRALQIVSGKTVYRRVVIGIDPGKTFGFAVLGDERVLKMSSYPTVRETVNSASEVLEELPATKKIVRVGDGADPYRCRLIQALSKKLPKGVPLETVSERETTRIAKEFMPRRKALLDAASAISIASRSGRRIK